MKIVKKLLALVLASALALTLLTGCGGGGGGGGGTGGLPDLSGTSYTANGKTATIGSANNANTDFSRAFIATFSQGLQMKLSYSVADGRRAQKYVDESMKLVLKNPYEDSEILGLQALQNAGINTRKQMIFVTDETGLYDQVMDIITQMAEFERETGYGLNCDGKTFGYTTVTLSGSAAPALFVLVNYTLV